MVAFTQRLCRTRQNRCFKKLALLIFSAWFLSSMTLAQTTKVRMEAMNIYSGASVTVPCSDLTLFTGVSALPSENRMVTVDGSGRIIDEGFDLHDYLFEGGVFQGPLAQVTFGNRKTCGKFEYVTAQKTYSQTVLLTWDEGLKTYVDARIIN